MGPGILIAMISPLGLGLGAVTAASIAATEPILAAAIDAGITYVDISDRPESTEQLIGAALRRHRDAVTLATKYGSRPRPGVLACATPAHTRASVERSLRNLGTDRIDLLYLHRPDPATPIADTLGTLDELVRAGKIREIGCSKFTAAQLREADAAAVGTRFTVVQNQCNLLHADDERDVLPTCAELGISYVAYWPLAAGLLTGKYRRGAPLPEDSRFTRDDKWVERVGEWHTERNYDLVERLTEFAADHGHSLLDLAFGWLFAHEPVASVIAGASSPAQIRTNAQAATAWLLSAAEFAEVSTVLTTVNGDR
jgi:aryl-alcohol dehydrogenase-like predicted oxidoreductase